jgi:uncharacterized protein
MSLESRKKAIRIMTIVVLGLILIFALLLVFLNKDKHFFNPETNKIEYGEGRATPKYSITKISETDLYTLNKVSFEGKPFLDTPATIYGLLFLPKQEGTGKMFAKTPGILMLPGGGVKKEDEPAAKVFAELGYAVLVLDQRGLGETGGYYPNYDQDRAIFQTGKEPIQFLSVNDALKSIDFLYQIDQIDKDNIIIAGASMGGRYAIITAALDKRLKAAIIISSAGFDIENSPLQDDSYFLAIDPEYYVADISPRTLIMIHSTNDTMVPIADALRTFSKAKEPKRFYTIEGCAHGYCETMRPILEEELRSITQNTISSN